MAFSAYASLVVRTMLVGSAADDAIAVIADLSERAVGVDDAFVDYDDLLADGLGVATEPGRTGADGIVVYGPAVGIEGADAKQRTFVLADPVDARFLVRTIGIRPAPDDARVPFADLANGAFGISLAVI